VASLCPGPQRPGMPPLRETRNAVGGASVGGHPHAAGSHPYARRITMEKHMVHLTHLYEPGMTYLITTGNQDREMIFADAACARLPARISPFTQTNSMRLACHVIMPITSIGCCTRLVKDFERFVLDEKSRGGKYAAAPERFYLSKILEDFKRHTAYASTNCAPSAAPSYGSRLPG